LNGNNLVLMLHHTAGTVQTFAGDDFQASFLNQPPEDRGCGAGLESPHRIFALARFRLSSIAVLGGFLPDPSVGAGVMSANALVELAGDAADDLLVSDIGLAQTACG